MSDASIKILHNASRLVRWRGHAHALSARSGPTGGILLAAPLAGRMPAARAAAHGFTCARLHAIQHVRPVAGHPVRSGTRCGCLSAPFASAAASCPATPAARLRRRRPSPAALAGRTSHAAHEGDDPVNDSSADINRSPTACRWPCRNRGTRGYQRPAVQFEKALTNNRASCRSIPTAQPDSRSALLFSAFLGQPRLTASRRG